MRQDEINALRHEAEIASRTPGMTKVSLDDIGSPNGVRQQLQAAFEKSLRGHESAEKLVERLRKVANMSRDRAAMIAQTEKTRAANGSRYAQGIRDYLDQYDKAVKGHRKRPELPEYMWVNPLRAKEPRHEHVAISGTVRTAGSEFLPGLRYPGDPRASPRQTINCHCYIRKVVP